MSRADAERDDDFDLARCLDPIDPESFFSEHWERRPLVIARRRSDYFAGLLERRDVDRLMGSRALPAARVKLVNRAKELRFEGVGSLHRDDGTPDLVKAYAGYASGDTLIVQQIQDVWPPVGRLCRRLAEQLHCPVNANAYLTPRGVQQGFDVHYDTHDALVLQLGGRKAWKLYGMAADLPLEGTRVPPDRESLGEPREVVLESGDSLYLPRGLAHEARSLDDVSSLHLTVGLRVYTWKDLLGLAVERAAERHAGLRRALPPGGWLGGAPGELPEEVGAALDELRRDFAGSGTWEALGRRFVEGLRPFGDGHFERLENLDAVDARTCFEKRPGMLCLVHVAAGRASITYPGNTVYGPDFLEPVFAFPAGATSFRAGDLPDEIDEESKLLLLRRLVAEGLLTLTGE